jgi:hypothetical protein
MIEIVIVASNGQVGDGGVSIFPFSQAPGFIEIDVEARPLLSSFTEADIDAQFVHTVSTILSGSVCNSLFPECKLILRLAIHSLNRFWLSD